MTLSFKLMCWHGDTVENLSCVRRMWCFSICRHTFNTLHWRNITFRASAADCCNNHHHLEHLRYITTLCYNKQLILVNSYQNTTVNCWKELYILYIYIYIFLYIYIYIVIIYSQYLYGVSTFSDSEAPISNLAVICRPKQVRL